MISNEDIEKLAFLSRLSFTPEEIENLRKDFGPILDYIAAIEEVEVGDISEYKDHVANRMRDDIVEYERGEWTNALVNAAPESKDNFIKVKKVL